MSVVKILINPVQSLEKNPTSKGSSSASLTGIFSVLLSEESGVVIGKFTEELVVLISGLTLSLLLSPPEPPPPPPPADPPLEPALQFLDYKGFSTVVPQAFASVQLRI